MTVAAAKGTRAKRVLAIFARAFVFNLFTSRRSRALSSFPNGHARKRRMRQAIDFSHVDVRKHSKRSRALPGYPAGDDVSLRQSRAQARNRQGVANARVVRRGPSQPHRPRFLRIWPQGHVRSVDRRELQTRLLSRKISLTSRRRSLDTTRKATSCQAVWRAWQESRAVYDSGM